ncbi:pantoate--beta-alanine ligase [Methylomicrobium album]|uniref:Pantothenate synthetase n=1 Tax=Methylomicrobium album BG8 TaxID=686340 RepID=H8GHP7_METAL|nr:pantoate--beta-alanine ligase [Methylomicrobium album]EIC31365.1 pantoate--beta-alanine ligase [Methylomicrobium album BG8]
MQTVKTIVELRAILGNRRRAGERIAFVPTMGNLHAGHIRLVETARRQAERVVVSIFVNPTQFGPGEDFETYPRTEAEDREKLLAAGADLLFLPEIRNMYDPGAKTVVSVKELSDLHCGAFRPGHFDGVATVVAKLFNIVQPDSAFFGLKDYQQFVIIRTMVRDLNIPVALVPVETVREPSGLAMSSRNGYLTETEKVQAAKLYQALLNAKEAVLSGGREAYADIERQAQSFLAEAGFKTDYFSICRSSDLVAAVPEDREIVILAAARLGKTRLIDNIAFSK